MLAKRVVAFTMFVICFPLAAEAARGGRAVRLDRMIDSDDLSVARAATAATTPVAPAPDTAHFIVPFVLPGDATFPLDVNGRGVVVGSVTVGDSDSAFVFRDGPAIVFDPPRGTGFSELVAVNNRGDAVGDYLDAAGIDRGFLRTADGKIADLPDPVPNFTFNLASGINTRGTIVGSFTTGPNFRSCTGYVFREGRYQIIDIAGATCVFASGINDRGDIVGNWFDVANFSHGFLIPGDGDDDARRPIVDITIDGFSTVPFHINNRREIVGDYFIRVVGRRVDIHGFVRREGEVRTLDDPQGFQTFLTGLNDGGVIAGFSTNGGILAIPTSERSSHGD
jgi:hypothetical protein